MHPAYRNDRGDRGNVGIIRSPVRASILPDYIGSEAGASIASTAGDVYDICDILELANAHAQCSWSLSTESERRELLTGMKINGAKEESRSQAPSLEQRS